MRKLSAVVVLGVAAVLLLESPLAQACGDKLLSIARGLRLKQAYQARHPASILLYVGDLSRAESSKTERNRLVQLSILYMSLRQAGHELQVAQNGDELSEALHSETFQFLMVDPSDVDEVAVGLAASGATAELVPVLYKSDKSDVAKAREHHRLVLQTPATSIDHLEAIDEALEPAATAGH